VYLQLLLATAVFVAGIVGCSKLLPSLPRRNDILPGVLVNTSLAYLFFGLLLPGVVALWLFAGFPGTFALACSRVAKHSTGTSNPPQADSRAIRLFPTKLPSLLLVTGVVLALLYRLHTWREANDAIALESLDAGMVAEIAAQSPAASRYLASYSRKNRRTDIAPHHLLHVCGTVLRLAEAERVRPDSSSPTVQACRHSLTYVSDLGVP
jgi:TRAP-type C4-dicarboxylate transport system permease large subunit